MARDATARLYDVDEDAIVFKKFNQTTKYDYGTVKFQAKQGSLVDLDLLHESIWATRLSDGTRSGLVSLDVVARGNVAYDDKQLALYVDGADARFDLDASTDDEYKDVFARLEKAVANGDKIVSVSGRIDRWIGRWPTFLKRLPGKPRRILVTDFETAETK